MCGLRGLWTSQGFKVQTVSSVVFSSNSLQRLTFTQFWENCLTTTCWFPRVSQQTAKTKDSVKCTTASQRGVLLLPLRTHQQRTLWHVTSSRCVLTSTRKEASDPKPLGRRASLQFPDPQVPPLYCQHLWTEQRSLSRTFCEIHTTVTSKARRTS